MNQVSPLWRSQDFIQKTELSESLLGRLIEDSNNILKLMNQRPKSLYIYCSPDWAYNLFDKLVESRKSVEKTSETLRKFFAAYPDIDKKLVANTLTRLAKTINELGEDFLESYRTSKDLQEKLVYESAQKYIGNRLGVRVTVHGRNEQKVYDPKKKAPFALPFKPALYFE